MIFKLMVDMEQIDLNRLCELTQNMDISMCFGSDEVYFDIPYDTSRQISNIMRKMKISDFLVKQVVKKPVLREGMSFCDRWCLERMETYEREQFEKEHQDEIKKMAENIEMIRQNLIKDKLLKEESANGQGRETKTRQTEESGTV